jgi:hypothetical protein
VRLPGGYVLAPVAGTVTAQPTPAATEELLLSRAV